MTRHVVALTIALALLPATASAQAPTARPSGPPASTTPAPAPSLPKVDGSRLVAGRWAYDQSVTINGQRQVIGRRTLSLAPATYGGAAAWLAVDATEAQGVQMTDSLYLSRDELTPIHRAMTLAVGKSTGRLVNDFYRDSVTGSVTSQGTTTPISLRTRPGAIANSAHLELLLRALPLSTGWRASAEVLAPPGSGAGVVSVQLAVTGSESVTTAAGAVDCWTATVRGQGGEQKLWIARKDRRVQRIASTSPMAPGALIELALVP